MTTEVTATAEMVPEATRPPRPTIYIGFSPEVLEDVPSDPASVLCYVFAFINKASALEHAGPGGLVVTVPGERGGG